MDLLLDIFNRRILATRTYDMDYGLAECSPFICALTSDLWLVVAAIKSHTGADCQYY